MIIHKVTDRASGQKLAAELFIAASNAKPNSPVGLATGGTMEGVYEQLVSADFKPGFQHAFALDEYHGISPDSKNSYLNELTDRFAKALEWQGELHAPGQGDFAGQDGSNRFEELIRKEGPLSVQLLGIGTNGHIAFNEPGSDFSSRTRKVQLHPETMKANSIYFENPSLMPVEANTQGLATIAQADMLLLVAFGETKKQALTKALHSPDNTTPLAALLNHKNLVIVTDLEV